LRIGLDAIKLEHHRSSGDGAAFTAECTIGFNSTQPIVAPFFIALTKRWHCQLDAMKKIPPTPRRQFSLPSPIDVHRERSDEHNNKETDEKPTAFQSSKL